MAHGLRSPCKCGSEWGTITTTGGQDVVRCAECGAFQYNAPKTETGRAVRTVATGHAALKPKAKSRILERFGNICYECGARPPDVEIEIGHILSVDDALAVGLPELSVNDEANLYPVCKACNLGRGSRTLPLWLAEAIFRAKTANDAWKSG